MYKFKCLTLEEISIYNDGTWSVKTHYVYIFK
jgi:hypothetical protein